MSPLVVTRYLYAEGEDGPGSGRTFREKHDRQSNAPLFVVELVAKESDNGAEVIKVTVAGAPPNITEDQQVAPVGLQALPWAQNGRNGVAFRAESIEPVQVGKASSAGSIVFSRPR